jgi:hypothetical protein
VQDWNRISPGLGQHAISQGWWPGDGSKLDFVGALSFWGDNAISVVVGALAGALLWRTPLRAVVAAPNYRECGALPLALLRPVRPKRDVRSPRTQLVKVATRSSPEFDLVQKVEQPSRVFAMRE